MNSIDENKKLRNFGLLFAFIFSAFGLYKSYQHSSVSIVLAVGIFFLVSALAFPKVLYWPEKAWMKFGDFMSAIMTRVMVFLLFAIAITPLGLIMRLIGKNPLKLGFDKNLDSYWEPFDKEGPGSRHFSPF